MNIESAKVRDRTSDELLSRKNEFFKICNILDELNIDYYLHGGVLLGAIRDQDFIRWDWGIDIRVLYNGFLNFSILPPVIYHLLFVLHFQTSSQFYQKHLHHE